MRETGASRGSQLSDFIEHGRFDDVVSAIKSISKFYFHKGVQNVERLSLSLKIGYSLEKCVNILQGQALQRKDKGLEEDVDIFERLLVSEWSYRVLHHSIRAHSTKKGQQSRVVTTCR